jgi:carboxymethylenebutenolidase
MEQQVEQQRLTAKDFHPEILKLFDRYVHGMIDRRGFLDGAAKFAVGGMTAAALSCRASSEPPSERSVTNVGLEIASTTVNPRMSV